MVKYGGLFLHGEKGFLDLKYWISGLKSHDFSMTHAIFSMTLNMGYEQITITIVWVYLIFIMHFFFFVW